MLMCPNCGNFVKVRQEWRYNRTWFYIHCNKCGKHMKSLPKFRGEPTEDVKNALINRWIDEATIKEAKDRLIQSMIDHNTGV